MSKDAREPWGMRWAVSGFIRQNLTRLQAPVYSLAQQQFILLLIPRIVFIFKDCVARADIFASPQKSV